MGTERVTLKDIAKACGYTANTVSRGMRDDPRLPATTRQKIREAAEAPEAEVYYYAHAPWKADQTTHAACLYQIIEQNESLPEDRRIRMVGFSDNIDDSEENADANNDGKITIADVTALISSLLSGEPLPPKDEPIEGVETFTVNGVTFTMVAVEGGTFTMGATPEQGTNDPWTVEYPTHEVTLSSFSIGETEVTQALWQAVMGSNPSNFTGDLSRPVEMVSWDDCLDFIARLNQMTGKTFRLPTEAEWEYAARGGNKTLTYKYAGSNDIDEVAWWDTNSCDGVGPDSPDYGTHPVALKKANELGLYDMSGNVWEWCQDWFGNYSSEPQTNPTGPSSGDNRVYRGGSWINYAKNCRVSSRFHWAIDGANNIGLRLVL